jgi:hypothetical protein
MTAVESSDDFSDDQLSRSATVGCCVFTPSVDATVDGNERKERKSPGSFGGGVGGTSESLSVTLRTTVFL